MEQTRFLYIGSREVFSRHELGFIVALSDLGKVDVLVLGAKTYIHRLTVASDNSVHTVSLYEVPCSSLTRLRSCVDIASSILDTDDYNAVFATPRLPLLVAKALNTSMRRIIVLRLWSIRAAKLRDNLRFGAYEDMLLFMPSLVANFYYILSSTYSMTVDHATYTFAKKTYAFLADRVSKVYPPYGFIPRKVGVKKDVPEIVDKGGYILGFTILAKKGAYLKFEAKPHAIVLYLLAKRAGLDVALAGSSYDDWKRVFLGIEPPRNLHIIGKGFEDDVIAKIYRNALLVVTPITNRNISNRLLEALFYGKPIITTEVVRYIHPELGHKRHVFISTWDTIVEDSIKLLKNEDMLKHLEQGAREAYNKLFATKHSVKVVKRLISK